MRIRGMCMLQKIHLFILYKTWARCGCFEETVFCTRSLTPDDWRYRTMWLSLPYLYKWHFSLFKNFAIRHNWIYLLSNWRPDDFEVNIINGHQNAQLIPLGCCMGAAYTMKLNHNGIITLKKMFKNRCCDWLILKTYNQPKGMSCVLGFRWIS